MKNKIAFYAKFLTLIALMQSSSMVHTMARTGVRLAGDAFAGKTFGSGSAAGADLMAAQHFQSMDAAAVARRTQEAANQLAHRTVAAPKLAHRVYAHPAAAQAADAELFRAAPADTEPTYVSYTSEDLLDAADRGDVDQVINLLKLGINPNARDDYYKHTALHMASRKGHLAVVKELLRAGINPNRRDKFGHTALLDAVNTNHTEIAKTLLDAGADPDIRSMFYDAPLHKAAANNNHDMVTALLEKKADPNVRNRVGLSFRDIMDSVTATSSAGEKALIDRMAGPAENPAQPDLTQADAKHRMAQYLQHAVSDADADRIARLLAQGADPNIQNEYGWTALHEATYHQNIPAMKALLKAGANPHIKNKAGQTALDLAINRMNPTVLDTLDISESAQHTLRALKDNPLLRSY